MLYVVGRPHAGPVTTTSSPATAALTAFSVSAFASVVRTNMVSVTRLIACIAV